MSTQISMTLYLFSSLMVGCGGGRYLKVEEKLENAIILPSLPLQPITFRTLSGLGTNYKFCYWFCGHYKL